MPGDIVRLSAGDMIPADLRLLDAKDLFVNQSALTGESMPVEKSAMPAPAATDPLTAHNLAFMGANVVSGYARAVVVETGAQTCFGAIADQIAGHSGSTRASTRASTNFTWLMIGFMAVMAPAVFVINGVTKGDWLRGVALRGVGGRGADAGNAADDRDGQSRQGRDRDVARRRSSSSGSTPSRISAPWMCCAPTRPARSRRTASFSSAISTFSARIPSACSNSPISTAISSPACAIFSTSRC